MKELLVLETVRKDAVWGYELWTVSAHPHGDCIVKEGTYKGEHLSDLWQNHKDLFGDIPGNQFPLLVKIISAKSDLSVQVHPDDAYALKNEKGSLGKEEWWYILNEPDKGELMLGHNAASREEAENFIKENRWNEFINRVPVKKEEVIHILPGTIHSITGGMEVLEVQQNSDITYRLYDFDRKVNGQPRELHIAKSLDVLEIPDSSSARHYNAFPDGEFVAENFTVAKMVISNESAITVSDKFAVVSVIKGEGTIDGYEIKRGDSLIVPAGYGEAILKGRFEILVSKP